MPRKNQLPHPNADAINALQQQLADIHQAYKEWHHHIHEELNGYANDAIDNFVAYLRNTENGFGQHNDETHFQIHAQRDVTGQWFEEAKIGAELLSRSSRINKEIRELKRK
jgi:hypothetical protein